MTPSREPGAPRTIEQVLAQARGRLARLHPDAALGAQRRGALLVDIRPEGNRRAEGEIPGSLILERIVLEWRLDPASDARHPHASYDLRVVVVCNEGFASSLAAASLLDLGVTRATDLIGGYRAWSARGLLTVTGGTPAGELVAGRGGGDCPLHGNLTSPPVSSARFSYLLRGNWGQGPGRQFRGWG